MYKPSLSNKIPCIGSVAIVLICPLLRCAGTKFCLNPSAQHSHNSPDSVYAATTWLTQPALGHCSACTEPAPQNTHTYPATCTLAPPSAQMKSDSATISTNFNARHWRQWNVVFVLHLPWRQSCSLKQISSKQQLSTVDRFCPIIAPHLSTRKYRLNPLGIQITPLHLIKQFTSVYSMCVLYCVITLKSLPSFYVRNYQNHTKTIRVCFSSNKQNWQNIGECNGVSRSAR